jgi:hypothetical protein
MVVFNDPVPVENPALQAVLMALELRDAIGGAKVGVRCSRSGMSNSGVWALLFVQFDDEVFCLCPAAKCVSGMALCCFAGEGCEILFDAERAACRDRAPPRARQKRRRRFRRQVTVMFSAFENEIDESVLPDLTEAHLRELGFPSVTCVKL